MAPAQGTVLVQHTGTTNPTGEGFSMSGQGMTGPTYNDLGVDAWIMHTTNGSALNYLQMLTPIQQSEIGGANWDLTVAVRSVQASAGVSGGVQLSAGPEGAFFLNFGINSNGDPTVRAGSLSPVFVLTNGGSTYNTYQLLYDATAKSASLWVNGTPEGNNIVGDPSYAGSSWSVYWGEFQSPTGMQANWGSVSLEIIPEPSAMELACLGSGVLFYLRKRKGGRL
jgi:hypothetical protein